ncbi:hypothetical protein, partial [Nocardia amamiensis]|uniref:hypothetical protein n=1 Tax=Nocardia amamiensis TaxID=404578 RepID=UPI000A9631EC
MPHPRRASWGLPHPASRMALADPAFLVSLGSRVFRVPLVTALRAHLARWVFPVNLVSRVSRVRC